MNLLEVSLTSITSYKEVRVLEIIRFSHSCIIVAADQSSRNIRGDSVLILLAIRFQ